MKKIKNPWEHLLSEGYNCFGCSKHNPLGLKMDFYEDGDDVVSIWHPDPNYQGWLNTLHGGIQATLMDEIGAWFVSRKMQTSGVTTHLNVRYHKQVPTGLDKSLEIRAHMRERRRNFLTLDVTLSYNGEVCTSAEVIYFCFPEKKAREEYYFSECVLEE